LVDYLAEMELLILLDNFEHLLDGAQLVSEILREAPHVRCLATSREVLNLQEEWLYRVSGLSFPTANAGVQESSEWEAVQFFVERARRMRHNFDAEADLDDIVRICQLVEGTPLAIELAAAWARSMSPRAIASEIGEGLDLLTTSMRNVPERHRSMHAALERSWQSLDEPEKRVLAQLSVFRGGFRRKQAEAVARATLPLLANLVDRSLLRWEADGRYTMHELVRHFASEKLAESPEAESQALTRHADAFAAFLDQRREAVYGLRHYEVLEEIRPELANVRAALQWGLTHAMLDTLERLAFVHFGYCDSRGQYRENAETFERLVLRLAEFEQTTEVLRALAASYAYLSWCLIRLGKMDQSIDAAECSDAILVEHDLEHLDGFGTEPLAAMALAYHVRGDYDRALEAAERARRRDEVQADELNLMLADYVLSAILQARDDLDKAYAHAVAAISLAERHRNSWFLGNLYMELGDIAAMQGDLTEARRNFRRSYDLKKDLIDPEGMAVALNRLGGAALLEGNIREAERLHTESLTLYGRITDPGGRAVTLHGLANAAAAHGDIVAAADLYTQALEILEPITFWQRTLLVLVDVAALLAKADQPAEASRLLYAVQGHVSADASARRRATSLLVDLSSSSTAEAPPGGADVGADLSRLIAGAKMWLFTAAGAAREEKPQDDSVDAANQQLAEPLTARELEVLQRIAKGLSNLQIAEEFMISVGTVKYYSSQIYGKLAVSNRAQAVIRAGELGLLR